MVCAGAAAPIDAARIINRDHECCARVGRECRIQTARLLSALRVCDGSGELCGMWGGNIGANAQTTLAAILQMEAAMGHADAAPGDRWSGMVVLRASPARWLRAELGLACPAGRPRERIGFRIKLEARSRAHGLRTTCTRFRSGPSPRTAIGRHFALSRRHQIDRARPLLPRASRTLARTV